jgi:hypothetical protein
MYRRLIAARRRHRESLLATPEAVAERAPRAGRLNRRTDYPYARVPFVGPFLVPFL